VFDWWESTGWFQEQHPLEQGLKLRETRKEDGTLKVQEQHPFRTRIETFYKN